MMKQKIKRILQKVVGFSNYQKLIEKKVQIFNPQEALKKKNALEKMANFYSQFLKEGDLCFDVGANMGNRIEAFLKIGAKPVAIEPQHTCCQYLKGKFKNKIVIVQKGCSSKEEEKKIYISDSSTISSFSEEWIQQMKAARFKEYTWEKTENVQLTTLDLLIQQFGVPKFIKIDVEGFEPEVLKGLSQKIPFVSFEYTEPEQHANTKECIDLLIAINPDVQFNYSVLETMNLNSEKWLSAEEMKTFLESETFIRTGFGDIYARNHT